MEIRFGYSQTLGAIGTRRSSQIEKNLLQFVVKNHLGQDSKEYNMEICGLNRVVKKLV